MTGWQPMKTSPPHGVWFIGKDGNAIYPCVFNEDENLWVGVVDFCFVQGVLPQEWHPLPKATSPRKETYG